MSRSSVVRSAEMTAHVSPPCVFVRVGEGIVIAGPLEVRVVEDRSQLLPLVGAVITEVVLHRTHRSPVIAVLVVVYTLQVHLKSGNRRVPHRPCFLAERGGYAEPLGR